MARKEGPKLPKGGYKRLTTKKKLAETAAFYAGMSAKMLSGGNTKRARAPYGMKRGRGRPSKAALMLAATENLVIAPPRVRRQATAKQLAALAKARAARAAKRGPQLAYGQYF